MATTRNTVQRDLNEFLRQYRKALHSTTGQSPAQLFLGRNLRTRLDLVRPEDIATKITEKQQAAFEPTLRIFNPMQKIYFLSGNPRMDKWISGTITTCLGDLHYEIDYNGRRFKWHVDQIRAFEGAQLQDSPVVTDPSAPEDLSERPRRVRFYGVESKQPIGTGDALGNPPGDSLLVRAQEVLPPPTPPKRRPPEQALPERNTVLRRSRQPPLRYIPS